MAGSATQQAGRAAGRHDAIVVGAGHNGLVCAAYLARAGLDVVVLERASHIGGACVTGEPWPGYRVGTVADTVAWLDRSIVSELGLRLRLRAVEPAAYLLLPDAGGVAVPAGPGAAAVVAERFPRDAAGFEEMHALFAAAATRLRPTLDFPATRRQVRRALRAGGQRDLPALMLEASIAQLCERYLTSPALQGLCAAAAVSGSAAGPRTPGTAFLYLRRMLADAGGTAGTRAFVHGGIGSFTEALAATARGHGASIRTGVEVTQLRLGPGRRAGGVVTLEGDEIEAPVVVSNATPARTAALVPDDAWPPEFLEDVALLPTAGSCIKVNCALAGLPRVAGGGAGADGPGPEHTGVLTLAPSLEHVEASARAAADGELPDAFVIEAVMQSATEEGLAPPGHHVLSIRAQHAPRLGAEAWDRRRDRAGEAVLASLEPYLPGLRDLVVDVEVLTPADLEARFGLTGGACDHAEMLPDWMFDRRPARGWNRHRLPIAGLYACGAGTHPGGGVSGLPGRNAARAVLADLVATP